MDSCPSHGKSLPCSTCSVLKPLEDRTLEEQWDVVQMAICDFMDETIDGSNETKDSAEATLNDSIRHLLETLLTLYFAEVCSQAESRILAGDPLEGSHSAALQAQLLRIEGLGQE